MPKKLSRMWSSLLDSVFIFTLFHIVTSQASLTSYKVVSNSQYEDGGTESDITSSTALIITRTSTTNISILNYPLPSTIIESKIRIALVNMSLSDTFIVNMESPLTVTVLMEKVAISTQASNESNPIVLVLISVLIVMAITMVTGFVVCSIIIGIKIRSRKMTQYGLANKLKIKMMI